MVSVGQEFKYLLPGSSVQVSARAAISSQAQNPLPSSLGAGSRGCRTEALSA